MKKTLHTLAAIITTSASALAADLPLRQAYVAPILPPPLIWSGPFFGGSIGGFFGGNPGNKVSGKNLLCVNGFCDQMSISAAQAPGGSGQDSSFAGGLQLGYNLQISPVLVFGGVIDVNSLNRSGSSSHSQTSLVDHWQEHRTYADSFKQNWLSTARLRFGPTYDPFWIYVTGGLALGDLSSSSSAVTSWAPAVQPTTSATAASGSGASSGVAWGWSLGVGAEYKFSQSWSVFGEYLYYNLNKSYDVTVITNASVTGDGASTSTYHVKAQGDGHLLKVGLNYAFWTY
jgi:outer membrane immunogenic protein